MPRLISPVTAQDHILGAINASVTLVEYGDFECPHCRHAHQIVPEILEQMGPQLRLVYRHFPLSTLHPHAETAAIAAEAAGVQGRFWEMHDLLFEHQDSLEDHDLREYAEALDLDIQEFNEAIRSRTFLARIQEDQRSGVRSGVNGTPTFFINGERHDGSFEFADLYRAVLQAAEVRSTR